MTPTIIWIYVREDDIYVEIRTNGYCDGTAVYETWSECFNGMFGWFKIAAKIRIN